MLRELALASSMGGLAAFEDGAKALDKLSIHTSHHRHRMEEVHNFCR